MKLLNPQVAVQYRDGSVDKLEGTLFEALTACQDSCKVTSKFSPKRIMTLGVIRKSGSYKPFRDITVDPVPQPPKTYA